MSSSSPAPASVPSRGDVIEVTVEKVVFGGDGLVRLDQGFVLFIPFAAEGDRLRVRVTEKKAHHARGGIVEILQPGSGRAVAPCRYYGNCGGCQYQHLSYAEELRLKENQVREAFARVGKLSDAPVRTIIAGAEPYTYRNRITVHAEAGHIGFRSVSGRELVDIEECLLAQTEVNEELRTLRARHPAAGHYSLRSASVPPSGFFQANQELGEALKKLVEDSLPDQGELLIEGYCGGGFFTGQVAGRFRQVVAVDNDPRTLRDAYRLGLTNTDWREGDAAEVLPQELAAVPVELAPKTSVLLDPPREGLPLRLSEALCLTPMSRLVYVSCDPATLARDARLLAKTYRLESVQPIDLFPRTAQIECVTTWHYSESGC